MNFVFLPTMGNLKARLRISLNFLKPSHGSPLWLFVEEPHDFGRILGDPPPRAMMVIWFEGTHDLCTTFNGCDIWIWFYVCKDLVNHLVATKVKLFDDAIKETKLYHSVVCNDHTFNVTTFFGRYSIESRSKYVLKVVSSIACYFSGVRLFDIQEVDGTNIVPNRVAFRKNHIQVSMMAEGV